MVIITGASDGLGKQFARVCKESGKKVVNISRNDSEFAYININTDLVDANQIEKAAEKINNLDEKIEAIVYCAGIISIKPLSEITPDEIRKIMGVNIDSQIYLTSLLHQRIEKDNPDIICVSSTVGIKGNKNEAVYGASKWAVRGFATNLQEEFKNSKTRVISLVVGGFQSKIFEKATGKPLPDPENWMKPEDIAVFMKQILDLPKIMEVTEVVIKRKPTK